MTPNALLAALRDRGFALTAADGRLIVRPASALTPADRAAITAHLTELVVAVASGWDSAVAVGLLTAADALLERVGASGTHPAVAAAAEAVCGAYDAADLIAVRSAIDGFERAVRAVGGSGVAHRRVGPKPAADRGG